MIKEYNNKSILKFNNENVRDEKIGYYSVGSGLNDFNYRNSYTYANIFNYNDSYIRNDGIIAVEESEEGNHIANYDVDQYTLLGQGANSDKYINNYAEQIKLIDFSI